MVFSVWLCQTPQVFFGIYSFLPKKHLYWTSRESSLGLIEESCINEVHAGLTRVRVDKSWQARVCMRVFSTLIPWSNVNKSCVRVDWVAKILINSHFLSSTFSSTLKFWTFTRLHESWWEFQIPSSLTLGLL
jgi:hypothetical protein